MAIKLYNTLSRKKEVFKPIKNKKVQFFVCGPTVYDYMHIGHAKTYIQFDVIVKYLRFKGYNVFYLQNITDLDDKIIKKSQEEKIGPLELARKFEKYYHEDEKKLNITAVTKYAKATDYIKQITKQTKTLIQKGYVYKSSDGYYFDISKFADYGNLSHRTVIGAEDAISRIDDSIEKKNKGDFCLWKFSKPNEPSWNTELGKGRPGWHIEDTAITETHFGPQYDIHGGARDLIFPHHEAEIAQMESASGKKPLVKYWMHTGFLSVGGKKMSKSLGNFVTIKDILKKYDYKALRILFITTHYRDPLNFSLKSLQGAQDAYLRLKNIIAEIKDDKRINKKYLNQFESAFNDDFNMPKALSVMWAMLRDKKAQGKFKTIKEMDKVFGLKLLEKEKLEIPKQVQELIKKREQARKDKNWQKSDELREKIKSLGYLVEDTTEGQKIKKI